MRTPQRTFDYSQAERRQLTLLFCDLVGSSELASRLDAEDLRDVLRDYRNACTAVVKRYGGAVSRFVGDGMFALFCYPQAHEDDAERAVLAALHLVSAIPRLSLSGTAESVGPLAVRIGIATGLVVIGDVLAEGASEKQDVVGETPNLAARLQGLASPNAIVIAPATRALLGNLFQCEDMGSQDLRGFADPVRPYRVVAALSPVSRFAASQRAALAPIVDREAYTRWLRELWREVGKSRGRVALLAGEAGIGKSRIVETLREKIAGTPYAALGFQCSPHYVNTALHPVIEYVARAASIGQEDTAESKLESLLAWLATWPEREEAVPLLAALLSIPCDARFPMPVMSPRRQKERTFELLLGFMQRLAAAWPLPILFEDVHWIDPTTEEFLTRLIGQVREMRALVVVTFRPEFKPPWLGAPHVEMAEVKPLPEEHATDLAERVAEARLPKEVIDQVVVKTGGVPLFIEELTRAVADAPRGDQDAPISPGRAPALLAVPSTLKDSLMARLDQLGAAKSTAQIAGVIGREFSYGLLEAVAQLPPERLREDLRGLEESGLVYRVARMDEESYVFKHALVQEAASDSLLLKRRRELHTRVAETLELRFPQTARDAPELVAHHWTEAGAVERAVEAWLSAGRRASERSEYTEAIAHLRHGLRLVPRLGDRELQRTRELALLLALGPALITTEGGGTAEVATVYRRALELCEEIPESGSHFVAQWGWWRTSMNHRTGRQRADKMLELAHHLGDPQLLVQAHHSEWATLYMLGAHSECCRHVEAGLSVYELKEDRVYSALYGGHDAKVCGLGEAGLANWMLGRPDRAVNYSRSALDWAGELSHVGSRAHAMDYAMVLQKFRRDVDAVHRLAVELFEYASEQKLRVPCAKGAFFRGWARATLGDVGAGLPDMLEAIASEKDSDTPTDFPLYYEMLAQTFGRAGRIEEGLRAVADGFAVAESQGIVFWNAELHRRRGELLLLSGARDAAQRSFDEALACARAQEACSLELRAATSLARLRKLQGDADAVGAVIRPVYQRFTEGFDTPDLAEARKLLEENK